MDLFFFLGIYNYDFAYVFVAVSKVLIAPTSSIRYNFGQERDQQNNQNRVGRSLEDLAISVLFWRISIYFQVTDVSKIGTINTFEIASTAQPISS